MTNREVSKVLGLMKCHEQKCGPSLFPILFPIFFHFFGKDVTSRGRIDLTVKINDNIYILEFKLKVDGNGNALEQIKKNCPRNSLIAQN